MLQVEEAGGTTVLESRCNDLPCSDVAAVADGMGGEGGEMAARQNRALDKLGSQECNTTPVHLQELINSINWILGEAEENPSLADGTTLTGLVPW